MRAGLAIVLEHMLFEPVERDGAQEARRHDAVGIDVLAAQRDGAPFNLRDALHHQCTSSSTTSRTSTTSPAMAAAATMAGLISSVRPVGLPCRPLKLRFEEAAQ